MTMGLTGLDYDSKSMLKSFEYKICVNTAEGGCV